MSDAWFHMPGLPDAGETVELDPAEARHAQAARRLEVGDAITLFDGQGGIAEAIIAEIAKRGRSVRVEVRSKREEPRRTPEIHLASALPKGDRQAVLLSMMTQLGAASFTPLECERSAATPGRSFRERSMRICTESCKQSRRARLPEIRQPMTPGEATAGMAATGALPLCAHPTGGPPRTVLDGAARELLLLIGPEGGFTDQEIARMIAAGARPVSLGEGILRIETAAIALLAWARLRSI